MLRSLKHYWRVNIAVVAAAAVATAVLAGAVIVGDSMRASLRQLTLDRLGRIDWALLSEEPFRQALANDIEAALADLHSPTTAAPALVLKAAAVHAQSRALAGGVALIGVESRFSSMFDDLGQRLEQALEPADGQLFPAVVLNHSLARELGAEPGDAILISFAATSDIPRESLLGAQPQEQEVVGLRLVVTAVIPDRGPGRFNLTPHQQSTYNAFAAIDVLQKRLDRPGEANAIFVGPLPDTSSTFAATLERVLAARLRLEDLGLEIERSDGLSRLSSRRFVLREHTVERTLALLRSSGSPAQPLLGYLANELRVGERSVPYSMVVGVDAPAARELGSVVDLDGRPLPSPGDDQIVLNRWAAEELATSTGDRLEMTYYAVGPSDELVTRTAELEVTGIAAMAGLMIDDSLLPEFPGIADADDIAAWEPPFPMDLGLIRSTDEEYWDLYGAAPKGVVSLATAQRLWANRFGNVTTIRTVTPADGSDPLDGDLLASLDASAFGLSFQPVKERGLAAAAGATDFAGLFIGFSIFLIASAALVVGLLFSLSVELRAREVGLRRAIGFPQAMVRRQLLSEGLMLAVVGGVVGAALAVAYAAILIAMLERLWKPMLDLPLLFLDLQKSSLLAAVGGAILLVAMTVVLGLRRLTHVSTPALLAGVTRAERSARHPVSAWLSILSLALAAIAIAIAIVSGAGSSPAYFFAAGALLIVAGFAAFSNWCRRPQATLARSRHGSRAYLRIVARNSAHNPGRSLLAVALVGCAAFMLVSVAANRRELRPETLGHNSGTGGFTLIAESDSPLRGDLNDRQTLANLGLEDDAALQDTTIFPLRLRPGEDASCLNLYQPDRPRVVGVTAAFIDRGGFRFNASTEPTDNPWELLRRPLGDNVIPAIGDANSVRWILHSGLDGEIPLVDDHGVTVYLRLVALLDKSIFQSELVVAEEAFLRHFPEHGGYSYFLFDSPMQTRESAAQSLETALASYGLDVTSTADKLARFLGIEEMYLSTFQLLGGLGLILGTVGLGVVLVRNVNERRSELAMLRAFGFGQRSIAWMIVLENSFQLLIGLLIGTASGFLALLPHFLDTSLHLPWRSLALTLGTVVAVAMLSSLVGVSVALRSPLLPALKAD